MGFAERGGLDGAGVLRCLEEIRKAGAMRGLKLGCEVGMNSGHTSEPDLM